MARSRHVLQSGVFLASGVGGLFSNRAIRAVLKQPPRFRFVSARIGCLKRAADRLELSGTQLHDYPVRVSCRFRRLEVGSRDYLMSNVARN